ncbi:hypothetical protein CYMTET_34535, partial [Cymbomonas tetramitiformis]
FGLWFGGVIVGGALLVGENVEVLVAGSTFERNLAANGGAMDIRHNSTTLLRNSSFAFHEAEDTGGTIRMTTEARATRVDNVAISHSNASYGAALYVEGNGANDNVRLENITFRANGPAVSGTCIYWTLVINQNNTEPACVGRSITARTGEAIRPSLQYVATDFYG